MAFQSNNTEYQIISDGEITSIISHFSDDMIFDIINTNLNNKFRPYRQNMSNIVYSLEEKYKQTMELYPDAIAQIKEERNYTYYKIIETLCKFHNLTFTPQPDTLDIYSAAFYLYKLCISDFTSNIISFFGNYILKEKNGLYEMLHMNELKKNKDSSTSYSKKIYKNNNKLAVINANIEYVVDSICNFDISLDILLNTLYNGENKNIAKYLSTIIVDNGNIFKNFYVSFIQDQYKKAVLITNIRLYLQEPAMNIEEYMG